MMARDDTWLFIDRLRTKRVRLTEIASVAGSDDRNVVISLTNGSRLIVPLFFCKNSEDVVAKLETRLSALSD